MLNIDWGLMINWIVSGAIGLIFGLVGGYVTYRYDRRRDDINWQREKIKLEELYKHEKKQSDLVWRREIVKLNEQNRREKVNLKEQLERIWQQKIEELKIQDKHEKNIALRQELTRGLDNPKEAIRNASYLRELEVYKNIRAGVPQPIPEFNGFMYATEFELEESRYRILNLRNAINQVIMSPKQYNYIVIRVEGDSMNSARPIPIEHGDFVLIRLTTYAQDRDIVAVEIREGVDDLATLKRFERDGSEVIFSPESNNPEYQPYIFTPTSGQFVIRGVAEAVFKIID